MALVSFVATYSGAKWLTAEKLTPPPVVLAGAVSGGAQKKVPSFLALVTQLTRVELNVALHTLLLEENQSTLSDENMQAAKRDASTSLCLYETLVEAVSVIATLVDDETFELNDAMGRISATELGKTMETLNDIFRSVLSVLEDAEDRQRMDPLFIVGLLRCISCHIAENPLLEIQRVETLLPFLFDGFLTEWLENVVVRTGCDQSGAAAYQKMYEESLVRFFAAYFVLITEEPAGVEVCVTSKWLTLTCDVLVKKYKSDDAMDAMFLDMVSGVVRQLMEKFASLEDKLSIELKAMIMKVIASTSESLGKLPQIAPDEESDDLTRLFSRVSLDASSDDVSDAFSSFAQRFR